jgi:hypothetical protein
LVAARAFVSESPRAAALAALAPCLTPPVLGAALEAAREIGSESGRAAALTALVPRFTTPERDQVLSEALAAARAIDDERSRAAALAALVPHLARLPCQALYPLWKTTLHHSATRPRKDLLADLRALLPVIATLGGEEAVVETFRAIQDVGRWWP